MLAAGVEIGSRCHATGSRKAAQTIAFYGNNERTKRDFLCLESLPHFKLSTRAPPSGSKADV